MQEGVMVWCEAALPTRVQRLIEEYGRLDYRQGMAEALERIRKRLGGKKFAEISGYLERWEMEPFMRELMAGYYDKVYYKTREWEEDIIISMEDYATATSELDEFIMKRFGVS
jgi:tRNA 2-selenouridine synthase